MEPEVNIRCRKSDFALVERILVEAGEEYKKMMKAEVKSFQKKDVPLNLILDQNKYLPEFNEKSQNPIDSCMGGVVLHTRKGRIVCSNTLDERLQLVYHEAIPEIREELFPCFKKPEKPEKAAPIDLHKH